MSKCFIAGLGFHPFFLLGHTGDGGGFITTLVYFVSRCSIARLNILDFIFFFPPRRLKGTLLIRAEKAKCLECIYTPVSRTLLSHWPLSSESAATGRLTRMHILLGVSLMRLIRMQLI